MSYELKPLSKASLYGLSLECVVIPNGGFAE